MPPRLRPAEEAIAPVLATLLLVAMTVVFASLLFLYASSLAERREAAPAIAFTHSDDDLVVVVAPASTSYGDLAFGGTCGGDVTVNGAAVDPEAPVRAGDRLACASGETLTIVHVGSGTLLHQQ